MVCDILSIGNPILFTQSTEIEDIFSDEVDTYIQDLIDTSGEKRGIGLALPQIGINKCIFLIRIKPTKRYPNLPDLGPQIFINPKILWSSLEQISLLEGCLSIPSPVFEDQVFAEVTRPTEIEVSYRDREKKLQTRRLSGLEARVFQHEYDHLEGILFPERVTDWKTARSGREIKNGT